jgi:hypothetical protein
MDEKLGAYLGSTVATPPLLTERKIVQLIEQRRKKRVMIWLSLAGLLWMLALYAVAFMVSLQNQTVGILLLAALSIGYICAGCFAGTVIKFRKVVL